MLEFDEGKLRIYTSILDPKSETWVHSSSAFLTVPGLFVFLTKNFWYFFFKKPLSNAIIRTHYKWNRIKWVFKKRIMLREDLRQRNEFRKKFFQKPV